MILMYRNIFYRKFRMHLVQKLLLRKITQPRFRNSLITDIFYSLHSLPWTVLVPCKQFSRIVQWLRAVRVQTLTVNTRSQRSRREFSRALSRTFAVELRCGGIRGADCELQRARRRRVPGDRVGVCAERRASRARNVAADTRTADASPISPPEKLDVGSLRSSPRRTRQTRSKCRLPWRDVGKLGCARGEFQNARKNAEKIESDVKGQICRFAWKYLAECRG